MSRSDLILAASLFLATIPDITPADALDDARQIASLCARQDNPEYRHTIFFAACILLAHDQTLSPQDAITPATELWLAAR